jgi:hypothetical protein
MERCPVSPADAAEVTLEGVCPGAIRAAKSGLPQRGKARCDKASDHAPVMLHLRACHASKAAIFTIPAAIFAGRKSKSRLNSKGLDR